MKKILIAVLCFGLFGGLVFADDASEKAKEQASQQRIDEAIALKKKQAKEDKELAKYCTDFKQVVETRTTDESGKITKFELATKEYESSATSETVVGYWLSAIDGEFPAELGDLSKKLSDKTEKTYLKLYRERGFGGVRHHVYKNSDSAPQKVIHGASLLEGEEINLSASFCPDYGYLADAYVDSGAGEVAKRKCRERLNVILTRGCAKALNDIHGSVSESDKIKKTNAAEHKKQLDDLLAAVSEKKEEALPKVDLSDIIKNEEDLSKQKKLKSLESEIESLRERQSVYLKKLEEFQAVFTTDEWKEKESAYAKESADGKQAVAVPFWDAEDVAKKFETEMGDFETVVINFSASYNKKFLDVYAFENATWKRYVKKEADLKSLFEEDALRKALGVYTSYINEESDGLKKLIEKDKEVLAVHFATKKYIQDRIKQIAFSSLSEGVSSFNVSQTLSTNPDSIEGDLTLFNDTEDSTNFFDKIIKLVTGIVGTLGVIILIIAIVMLVTANGDDTQISKAKELILYTVVGLLVIFMSYMIIQFVIDLLVF